MKLGVLGALGSEARAGLGAEGGVSWFGVRSELGLSVLAMVLWASESGLYDLFESENSRGPRENRDLVLMPRLNVSTALESTGFWRVQASGGFGPAWLRVRGGDAGLSDGERCIWSYAGGIGLSAGIVHGRIDLFGYLASAEEFSWSLISTQLEDPGGTRGAPGIVVSLALVVPFALSGAKAAVPPGRQPQRP